MPENLKKNLANIITSLGILAGIVACVLVFVSPSWIIAESLLVVALVTDGLDGKIARKYGSTKVGPYLDDIADFLNFGVHPGIWIWIVTGRIPLAVLYVACILFRLVRFTAMKQHTSTKFSGLPSPAGAIGVFGLVLSGSEMLTMVTGILTLSFLSLSSLPCVHVMKNKMVGQLWWLILILVIGLPFLFGGGQHGVAITQMVLIGIYILFSLISMIPRYVNN